MNLVFNNRTGDYYHDWYDIACKGTGKIISEVAKELWGKDIDVFWKKKSWLDKHAMQDITFFCSTQ